MQATQNWPFTPNVLELTRNSGLQPPAQDWEKRLYHTLLGSEFKIKLWFLLNAYCGHIAVNSKNHKWSHYKSVVHDIAQTIEN
jgi:hypothetical protein